MTERFTFLSFLNEAGDNTRVSTVTELVPVLALNLYYKNQQETVSTELVDKVIDGIKNDDSSVISELEKQVGFGKSEGDKSKKSSGKEVTSNRILRDLKTVLANSKESNKFKQAVHVLAYSINKIKDSGSAFKYAYWTYRTKPAGLSADNPADLVVELKNGSLIPISIKAGDKVKKNEKDIGGFLSNTSISGILKNILDYTPDDLTDFGYEIMSASDGITEAIVAFIKSVIVNDKEYNSVFYKACKKIVAKETKKPETTIKPKDVQKEFEKILRKKLEFNDEKTYTKFALFFRSELGGDPNDGASRHLYSKLIYAVKPVLVTHLNKVFKKHSDIETVKNIFKELAHIDIDQNTENFCYTVYASNENYRELTPDIKKYQNFVNNNSKFNIKFSNVETNYQNIKLEISAAGNKDIFEMMFSWRDKNYSEKKSKTQSFPIYWGLMGNYAILKSKGK